MSEKVTIKVERKKLHLPTIALRGLVVFPNNLVHFEVGREKSIAAVEWAMANNSNVFLVAQKSMDTTEPQQADLFSYGVVAEVKQVLRVSGDLVKVLVEGKYRAKLSALDASGDFLLSEVRPAPVRAGKADDAVETEALLRALKAGFDEYLGMNPRLGKDVVFAIVSSDDPAFLSEYMPANLLFRYEDKQAVMDEGTLNGRLKKLIEMLRRECQVMKIEKEIAEKVNESMDKNQRDYYLHEQLHIISDELGEGDDTHAEADEYRRRITGLHLAEDSEKKLLKEVDRLAKMQGSNQEATVIRTYLDTCLDLPWNTFTVDDLDISRAQQILDRDHYGLKKVKDRILETLAVRKLAPDVKAQIICLVGPPGVGKTSIARSIAESLGRKYVRISLGGVRDEAEIRGHRRTYIGAMPGKIITAMIGREVTNMYPPRNVPIGEEVLRVENITVDHPFLLNRNLVEDVSFSVRAGEVLGFAGLVGAGRSEVLTAVYGVRKIKRGGKIFLNGKQITISGPTDAMAKGISLVTEDRKKYGLLFSWSIMRNISITNMKEICFGKKLVISEKREAKRVEYYFKTMRVKAPKMSVLVDTLSGGNQQKVVIARSFNAEPKVLILDEPTKGIDVGSKSEIYQLINEFAAQGIAVIMISSELPELLNMCDRFIVMAEGRVVGELSKEEANENSVMALATSTLKNVAS